MIEKEVIVSSEKGLKSRVASQLVKKAVQFKSNIVITYKDKRADAKSLINVMALKVPYGAGVTISASGVDEVSAVEDLEKLLINSTYLN